jgi:hypothetical protein
MRFKGERGYVHGTDIVDSLHGAVASELRAAVIERIDCRFHRVARTDLDVQLLLDGEQPAAAGEAPVAVSSGDAQGQRYRCLVHENGRPVTDRVPFDEDEIAAASLVSANERTIELRRPLPYTRIETYSAMNKALVNACFPDVRGKWLAVRVAMPQYIERADYRSIVIALSHSSSPRLTESSITVDGVDAGRIYFSLVTAGMMESSSAAIR